MGATTTERAPFDPHLRMRKIRTRQGMMDYLDVKWRVAWFNDVHADDGSIFTEIISHDEAHARFKATVTITRGDGVRMFTGHGSETAQDFPDFFEKAETKAIGRALALAGYGTDMATDLDDEEPMDGLPAAKSERVARRMEPQERRQVDEQHERNATPPPSRLPSTRTRPATPETANAPADDSDLAVLREELRELGTRGFDLNRFLTGRNKELTDLTRGELEGILPTARDVVRKKVEKLTAQL